MRVSVPNACPMTGDAFRVYIEKVLVPPLSRGDTDIIDNLASHKGAGVREAIEAAGAELQYMPPYSPNLNPIALAFAKFKTGLGKAAERTVDELWREIGVLIDEFRNAKTTPRRWIRFSSRAAMWEILHHSGMRAEIGPPISMARQPRQYRPEIEQRIERKGCDRAHAGNHKAADRGPEASRDVVAHAVEGDGCWSVSAAPAHKQRIAMPPHQRDTSTPPR